MKTRAAILTTAPGSYKVDELDLDDPRQGEVVCAWSPPACVTPTTTSPPATCRTATIPSPEGMKAQAWSSGSVPTRPGGPRATMWFFRFCRSAAGAAGVPPAIKCSVTGAST